MKTAMALALTSLLASYSFAQPAPSASNVDMINMVTSGKTAKNNTENNEQVINKKANPPVNTSPVLSLNSNKSSSQPTLKCECATKQKAPKKIVKKKVIKKVIVKKASPPPAVHVEKEPSFPKVTEVDAFNPPSGHPDEHTFEAYKKWQTPLQPNELMISVSTNDLNNVNESWKSRSNNSAKDKQFIVEIKDLRTNNAVNAYDFKPIDNGNVFKVFVLNNHLDSIKNYDIVSNNVQQNLQYNALWKEKSCSAIHIIYQLKSQESKTDVVKFLDPHGNITDTLHPSCKLPVSNVRDTTFQLKDNAILNIAFKEPYFNDQSPLKYQLFLTQEGREYFDVSLQSIVLSEDLSKLYLVKPSPSRSGPYHGVHYEQKLLSGKYRLVTGPVNDEKPWINTSVDIMKIDQK